MDNATIHHSNLIKDIVMNWDASFVFNTIKSPFYNPAELIVGYIKSQVRITYYYEEFDLL